MQHLRCTVCFAFDRRVCLGGSDPPRQPAASVPTQPLSVPQAAATVAAAATEGAVVPAAIQFELPAISNVAEAASIQSSSPLGVLLPMGSVIEGFHSRSTSAAAEASELHHHLQIFLMNRVGDGENGCSSRNDGLLVASSLLVGCDEFGRDVHYDSTPLETRPDFTGLCSSVQVVVAEEKNGSIMDASSIIINKFRFPHNHSPQITVMFGFAISRSAFRIHKFVRDPHQDEPRTNELWFSSPLGLVAERVRCILAALNVGRVYKFYRETDLLIPSPFPLGRWIQRHQRTKQIKFLYDYMIVKSCEDKERLAQMKEFYQATAEVENLERLYVGEKAPADGFCARSVSGVDYLDIYLKPLGTCKLPQSPTELKTALLCVLRCIAQLHHLGYFHTDIRWFNVVKHGPSWVLVDCYDFCAATDCERRLAIKGLRSTGAVEAAEWCAKDDLLQVMELARCDAFRGDAYRTFGAVPAFVDRVVAGGATVDDAIDVVNGIPVQCM